MTGQVEKIRDDLKAGFLVAVLMARACRSEAVYIAPETYSLKLASCFGRGLMFRMRYAV